MNFVQWISEPPPWKKVVLHLSKPISAFVTTDKENLWGALKLSDIRAEEWGRESGEGHQSIAVGQRKFTFPDEVISMSI